MRARLVLLGVALWCSLTAGGCSAFFVTGPPPESERRAGFECTTSYAYPWVDVLMVGLTVVGIGLLASSSTTTNQKLAGIVGVPLLGGFTGSSIGGFWRVSHCRSALEE